MAKHCVFHQIRENIHPRVRGTCREWEDETEEMVEWRYLNIEGESSPYDNAQLISLFVKSNFNVLFPLIFFPIHLFVFC